MEADLHLDPDALRRLAVTVRRVSDGLPPCPPGHPFRSVRVAASTEMIAFAEAAERAVARVCDVDDEVADCLCRVDEIVRGSR